MAARLAGSEVVVIQGNGVVERRSTGEVVLRYLRDGARGAVEEGVVEHRSGPGRNGTTVRVDQGGLIDVQSVHDV